MSSGPLSLRTLLRHLPLHPRLLPTRRLGRRTLLHLLLPRHPRQPVEEDCGGDVEDDEDPHESEVPPTVAVLHVQLSQIGVRVPRGAEFALRCGVRVVDVTAGATGVGLEVIEAGLVGGWVEVDVFNIGTSDVCVGEAGR